MAPAAKDNAERHLPLGRGPSQKTRRSSMRKTSAYSTEIALPSAMPRNNEYAQNGISYVTYDSQDEPLTRTFSVPSSTSSGLDSERSEPSSAFLQYPVRLAQRDAPPVLEQRHPAFRPGRASSFAVSSARRPSAMPSPTERRESAPRPEYAEARPFRRKSDAVPYTRADPMSAHARPFRHKSVDRLPRMLPHTDPIPQVPTLPSTIPSTPPSSKSASSWRETPAKHRYDSVMSPDTTTRSTPMTEGSSVYTGESSPATEITPNGSLSSRSSHEEASVEECIDLYVDGFEDDPTEKQIASSSSKTDKVSIPSEELVSSAEPSSASVSSLGQPPGANGKAVSKEHQMLGMENASSDTVVEIGEALAKDVMNFRRIRTLRDHYGFKQESQHVSAADYNAWYREYSIHVSRRQKKWIHLMNSHGLHSFMFPDTFPARSKEVKRYIRKGIPSEWRGAAWFFYGDGASFLKRNEGLYGQMVNKASSGLLLENDRDLIERDLQRTFPDNIHFKPEQITILGGVEKETELIKSLRRILQAYAVCKPKVGYCQSLNFLAGHLLLFLRLSFPTQNFEERAFAMLCILTERYLPGTHSPGLEGCNVDIGVLMTILQETMPALWAKVDDSALGDTASPSSPNVGSRSVRLKRARTSRTLKADTELLPTVSLATTAWFMSCFVSTLPTETVCRVWDCLWYEGSKTMFRVALAIFKLCEKQIRTVSDPMEVFAIVQALPRSLLDANSLMDIATMKTGRGIVGPRLGAGAPGFGALSQKTVEQRREQRRRAAADAAVSEQRRSRGREALVAAGPPLAATRARSPPPIGTRAPAPTSPQQPPQRPPPSVPDERRGRPRTADGQRVPPSPPVPDDESPRQGRQPRGQAAAGAEEGPGLVRSRSRSRAALRRIKSFRLLS